MNRETRLWAFLTVFIGIFCEQGYMWSLKSVLPQEQLQNVWGFEVFFEPDLTSTWWCLSAGWTSACQRPTHRSQRRVIAREDQPGLHGNATQIHVGRGQQARDDPTHRGPTGGQRQWGSLTVREESHWCARDLLASMGVRFNLSAFVYFW